MRKAKIRARISHDIPMCSSVRRYSTELNEAADGPTNTKVSDYWERLGKPKTVLAPMVSQSDLAFRLLCRKYGTDLCFTQMNHAQNFVTSKSFQDCQLDVYKESVEGIQIHESGWNALKDMDWNRFDSLITPLQSPTTSYRQMYENGGAHFHKNKRWTPYDENFFKKSDSKKSPLIVQIAGHDPSIMSEAARLILHRTNTLSDESDYAGAVSGIDVNCGCPQAIARSGHYGAFLMEENPNTVYAILARLKRDLPFHVGVSVKIRIPEGGSKDIHGKRLLKDRILRLIDSGVDLITVHGRTLKENKTKTRECDWDAIALAVQISRDYSGIEDFPIVANGGIEFPSDVRKLLDYTQASAVMSSEGILENPGLFMEGAMDDATLSPSQIFQRQVMFCNDYLDFCMLFPPLSFSLGKIGGSFNCIRGHIFKLLYRYLDDHTDLRDLLGHPRQTTSITDARRIIMELSRRYSHLSSNEHWQKLSSSNSPESSWYRRHRNAISLVHVREKHSPSAMNITQDVEEKKQAIRNRILALQRQSHIGAKLM